MTFKILKNDYVDERIQKIEKDEIFQNAQSNISIDGYLGSILQFFIKAFNVKRVLELGALYGKSAILMALSNEKNDIFVCSIENNEKNFEIAKQNVQIYNLENQIQIYFGDAMEILNKDENLPRDFDMVFVDANKLSYIDYLKWCEKNLKKGTILIFDNIFIHHVLPKYNDQNCSMFRKMEEFLQYTANEALFDRLIIPYERDGLCVLKML
jgi:predicted O-methyltransferase YrrM